MPRVLIVDDEAGIRLALLRWFSRQGWEVSEAADGALGLALLRQSNDADATRVDLIICDLHLPILSGSALHAALAAERPALIPRIIFSTGDEIGAALEGSVLASHPHVLQKPFELSALRALMATISAASER